MSDGKNHPHTHPCASHIRHRTPDIRHNFPAFTMIEVLMVVVIIGIMAALVVPQMSSSATFEVQGAARAIVADLLFAQNDAIANQQTRKVIFDLPNNRYRITNGTNVMLSAPWLGGSYQVSFGDGSRFIASKLTAVSFANTTLGFDELGAPSAGGTIDVIAGASKYRITITAITGKISVAPVTGG